MLQHAAAVLVLVSACALDSSLQKASRRLLLCYGSSHRALCFVPTTPHLTMHVGADRSYL
jgi:hypothetical protein